MCCLQMIHSPTIVGSVLACVRKPFVVLPTGCLDEINSLFSVLFSYRKNPKISDTRKFDVITLKVEQDGFSLV